MFGSQHEAIDHENLMTAISEMTVAEPPCWSYPEAFFEEDDRETQQRGQSPEQAIAISLCNGCEVRLQCLEYAMKWRPVGVWGGTTTSRRTRMFTERNRGY